MRWPEGFIAVDWGTTNRRAYRLDGLGCCVDEFEDDKGVLSVPSGGFPAAVAEIRARIMRARNSGTAVLLLSEDLDELLEMSDRIMVISEGKLVYETPARGADVGVIGAHMAGHH